MGPSASLRAIRMCLRPKLDNSNNALASSEALGCASCHLLCSCIIAIFYNSHEYMLNTRFWYITHKISWLYSNVVFHYKIYEKKVYSIYSACKIFFFLVKSKNLTVQIYMHNRTSVHILYPYGIIRLVAVFCLHILPTDLDHRLTSQF